MSYQPPNNNQNWLYFAFGAGATLVLGAIIFIVPNLVKSSQNPSSGTWKVEANGVPSGSQSITIVIAPDGKITALNPQNEKEAIEVGKITKVSDVATLPEGAKVQSNPFANQANRARQSEAKTYVGSMNRGQQAYFLEKVKWAKTIDEIGLGIKSETENYRYSVQTIDSIKTVNTKNYPGITVQTGIAKKEGLRSYLGAVYLSGSSTNDLTTIAILCELNEPTIKEAGMPKFDGKALQCPDGYTSLN
ncbi:MAG: type IV pilin-like G/H family protein [Pseudanabaena sp.]